MGTNVMMVNNFMLNIIVKLPNAKILILVSLVLIIPSLASATTLVRDTPINESTT